MDMTRVVLKESGLFRVRPEDHPAGKPDLYFYEAHSFAEAEELHKLKAGSPIEEVTFVGYVTRKVTDEEL